MEKRLKILQINSVCGIGSTGKIAEDLYWEYKRNGHDCVVAWGRKQGGRIPIQDRIQIGGVRDYLFHALEARLLDDSGFGSRNATKKFLKQVEKLDPEVIQLHNIHGYYINIEYLFRFLAESKKKVIWTLHDCWPITGHCAHFDYANCRKWQNHCGSCPLLASYPKSFFMDRSYANFKAKRELFTSVHDMVLVPVSYWLSNLLEKSFLTNIPKKVIHNGINTEIFKPCASNIREKYKLGSKKIVLGVAFDWSEKKGLRDFVYLADNLPKSEYQVVLIGLGDKQKQCLPEHIITIPKTNSQVELALWYTEAFIFVNPTYEDNFPSVNLEAQECGTPVVTYDTGGAAEAVPIDNVVPKGDVVALLNKILKGRLKCKTGWNTQFMTKQYINLLGLR